MEQVTFSTCDETTTEDKACDSKAANATSRAGECFRMHIKSKTSDDERASMIEACMIKKDKECEAYVEGDSHENGIETEVAKDESTMDGIDETSSTLLRDLAIASKNQRETQETKGGGEEAEVNTNNLEVDVVKCSTTKVVDESIRIPSHLFQRLGKLCPRIKVRPKS